MKKSNKGFTLMEMLIVVAIIAVLAAIMIPVFNGALTKAKEAADIANVRAVYAEWQTKILTEDVAIPKDEATFIGTTKLNYNDEKGTNLLTYSYTDGASSATITYAATKVDSMTWTLTKNGTK